METLFKHLSYDVEFDTKLGKQRVLQVSLSMTALCCILSFGGKKLKLYGSDNVPISIDSIVPNLKSDSCKTLKRKQAKSFFLLDKRTRAH